MKENKGITLIALVITIVILLILAGITIAMLTGENGILNKVNNAKTENIIGKEKEEIGLAYSYAKAEKLEKGDTSSVKKQDLEQGFNKNSVTAVIVTEDGDKIKVTYTDTKNVYTIETNGIISGPEQGKTEDTKPYTPAGATEIEGDANKGYTIKDSNDNEWVWVEVPKTIYETASSETDYINIEIDMQKYANVYRGVFKDTWYDESVLTEIEYNTIKNTMLSSVYKNGGFYIARYEVGDKTTTEVGGLGRTEDSGIVQEAVIKQNMYPYNYVTCSESQILAKGLATGGKTSSLMFGIQWDLVCKYMEEKGMELGLTTADRQEKIKNNSNDFGNYKNVTFNLIEGSYSYDRGVTFNLVSTEYKKLNNNILLTTTGATNRHKVLNIYDLAGNEHEWTLEYSFNNDYPCTLRGGYFYENRK